MVGEKRPREDDPGGDIEHEVLRRQNRFKKRQDAGEAHESHAVLFRHGPAEVLCLFERAPEYARIGGERRHQRTRPAEPTRSCSIAERNDEQQGPTRRAKAMLMTEIWFGVMGVSRRSAVSRCAKPLSRAAIGRRPALGLSPASGTSFIFAQNRMLQIYDCSES